MKEEPPEKMGSWNKAVTVADGAWLTRGFHSQNFTFHVRDYMKNSVLYYHHLCQRGKDSKKRNCTRARPNPVKGLLLIYCLRK